MSQQQKQPPSVNASSGWFRTVRAVAWSFIGLRKNSEYQKDIESLNPIQIVIVGLVALFLFVFLLIAIVYWIVR